MVILITMIIINNIGNSNITAKMVATSIMIVNTTAFTHRPTYNI